MAFLAEVTACARASRSVVLGFGIKAQQSRLEREAADLS